MEEFAILFDSSNCHHLPVFRMSLTFDDEKMEIYPTLQDLEATIFEILTSITNTLQVKNDSNEPQPPPPQVINIWF